MGTEIKTWQIVDGKPTPIMTTLKNESRTEPYDLEPWISSQPDIVGTDLLIIGRQVQTRSGPIDLLAVDYSGQGVGDGYENVKFSCIQKGLRGKYPERGNKIGMMGTPLYL